MDDLQRAWARITARLAPHTLGGPATPDAVAGAAVRMGVEFTGDLRHWLLTVDLDAGRRPAAHAPLVALGCPGVLPGGALLLGLTDIERVHRQRMNLAGDGLWRREWVPVAAEADGFHGVFVSTPTGTVGRWSEGEDPREDTHPSLAAFFRDVGDRMDEAPRPVAEEPVRAWARAHGIRINDRGRIPADVRRAYEDAD
ncbi:Lsr2 family protein [Streptomyces sp. OfavH-34-F]|uniref:Lsr2 family DNA-binding protein n=1 Tax=Streptomyces sp. OfavH-34-F TaxID=2917760 RepID=UPI001EF3999A|nr:histone-like nucleoid-structuring protein Lsr2 [Streptomyces sp. OfavH-34-F]MCG7525453.1 Lsr2 family protein [Streptomyces sp. OfavH-34-F]